MADHLTHSVDIWHGPWHCTVHATFCAGEGEAFGTLVPPQSDDMATCLSHIAALQITDEPSLFGLNPNADITLQQQQARQLVEDVLLMQPRVVAAGIAAVPAAAQSQAAAFGPVAGSSRNSSSASNDGLPAAAAAAVPAAYHAATMAAGIAELLSQVPEPLTKVDVVQAQHPVASQCWGAAHGMPAVAGMVGLDSMGLMLLQEMTR